jgi:hypothetical protein
LRLEDFERFVFIMSVLEHYSEHDCVFLLGASGREIRQARGRAFRELMDATEGNPSQSKLFVQEKE